MRRAFKVATAFTGAAACAAMFAPGAEAAAATTAKTQIVPNTTHKNCTIGPTTTSMVFWWFPSSKHGPTCAGSAGHPGSTTLNHSFSKICTGDNYGWMYTGSGIHWPFSQGSFYPTYDFVPGNYIAKVHISGHRDDSLRCST